MLWDAFIFKHCISLVIQIIYDKTKIQIWSCFDKLHCRAFFGLDMNDGENKNTTNDGGSYDFFKGLNKLNWNHCKTGWPQVTDCMVVLNKSGLLETQYFVDKSF